MDTPPEITDLAKVVEPHLNGAQLVSYSSRYLTKPGDNYGSIMLSISAKIQHPNGTIEDLPLVAKLPPVTNEVFWNLFQPEITSIRENAIYLNLAPSLRQLQLDIGIPETDLIDVFGKLYGCRISLNENATKLDRDAILVLENLQTKGYRAGKRQDIFDYDHIKVLLKYVAKYHALPIALRKLQSDKFKKDIKPKFAPCDMKSDPATEDKLQKESLSKINLALGDDKKAIKRCEELEKLFAELNANPEECPDGLFTTIAHYDMWINNVMILYDETGAPSKVKIVDFQIAQYESLVHDLIFLFLSSVDPDVLEEHYDDLLKYYYEEFIDTLKKTLCDISEYSYEKFLEEVKRVAPVQVYHALFMAPIILTEEKELPDDFKDISISTLNTPPSEKSLKKMRDIVRLSKKFGFFW